MADFSTTFHKIINGLLLRCPNCEKGSVSSGLLSINAQCPVCGVRFERRAGESMGGMMLNMVITEVLTVIGFIVVALSTRLTPLEQLWIWLPFNVLFPLLFFRHARSVWIAIAYLNGDVGIDNHPADSNK